MVVVPARDMAKAKAKLADMPDVRLEIMDLLDPGSIDPFAEQFLRPRSGVKRLGHTKGGLVRAGRMQARERTPRGFWRGLRSGAAGVSQASSAALVPSGACI